MAMPLKQGVSVAAVATYYGIDGGEASQCIRTKQNDSDPVSAPSPT